jgi:hypothetical protein
MQIDGQVLLRNRFQENVCEMLPTSGILYYRANILFLCYI